MTEEIKTFIDSGKKEIFKDTPSSDVSVDNSVDIATYLIKAGTTIPPWWSKRRDLELSKFWKGNDNLAGTMYAMVSRMTSIPLTIVPRDNSIVSHRKQAQLFNQTLWYRTESRSDRSQIGWPHGWGMFLQDLYAQDNGAFFAIEGPGRPDGPLAGRPTKLIHLESWRCTRTSNPDFPVVYKDSDGKLYKLHHTRVIAISSLPSTKQSMHGVGFCAVSRCVNFAQILIDQLIYKQEKLGSRPKEKIVIGKKGLTAEDIGKAFSSVDQSMDGEGYTRYSKTVVIAPNVRSSSAEIDLEVMDLVDAGTLFDEQISTTLGMYTIALAWGIPARWIWPATASGATKADAEYQHLAGMVQGPGEILRNVKLSLEAKFLPPHLMCSVDYQDDAQDEQQARIRSTRATQRKTDIEDGVITVRVAREQALSSKDITQEQFNEMELEDGRLPSGDSLLAAFYTKEPLLAMLLNVDVVDPLAIDENDAIQMIVSIEAAARQAQRVTQQASSSQQKITARIAMEALGALKEVYEQRATDDIVQEITEELEMQNRAAQEQLGQGEVPAQQQAQPEAQPETERPQQQAPPGETTEEQQEEEVKAFNFGARAGEVIGGGLARDPQGRFISASQLGAAARSRLLAKIRGAQEGESTEEDNRAAVLAEIADKIPIGGLDALATLGDGGELEAGEMADSLVSQGLAKRNPDGSVQISSGGASVLIAANRGNARGAQDALIRAQAQAKAEKPKAAAGGAAKPEKISKEEEQTQNRESVFEGIEIGAALGDFADGKDISQEDATALAQDGLVEFDSDGNPRFTKEGKALITAANKGELRNARDLLSKARDNVEKKREKAETLRNEAEQTSQDIETTESNISSIKEQIAQLTGSQDIDDRVRRGNLEARLKDEQRKLERQEKRLTDTLKNSQSVLDSIGEAEKAFGEKSQASYRSSLRRWMRAYWTDSIDRTTFEAEMFQTVSDGITEAWQRGIKEIGFDFDEISIAEKNDLQQAIVDETRFIPGLADFIQRNSRANDEPFSKVATRVDLWTMRYLDQRNRAKALVGKDLKFKWTLGQAQHCKSCLSLSGKVKRGSYWKDHVLPQNPINANLDCKGVRCDCSLVETKDRMSPGPLPALP